MIAALTPIAVALTVGLPIFALGEHVRGREERRLTDQDTAPTRKEMP